MNGFKPSLRSGKKSTIYDLARSTDVSVGTVSRVLNNRLNVDPETRERVLRAAKEFNLRPQFSTRHRQVAVIVAPEKSERVGGHSAILSTYLTRALFQLGIGAILHCGPAEKLAELFLDGLIVVDGAALHERLWEELETRMHVVFLNNFDVRPNQYAICSDHFNAGYLAAKHFISRGRRKLGFLGGSGGMIFAEALKGFRQAIINTNISYDERLFILCQVENNHLTPLARFIRDGVDSIYVPGADFQAMECLHNLSYVMGVKIPQQIALIGGENDNVSCLQNPPLTTIKEPLFEMANQAAIMMDSLTGGNHPDNTRVMLPVRLIERDSVG